VFCIFEVPAYLFWCARLHAFEVFGQVDIE
jgi:hypothetical protein